MEPPTHDLRQPSMRGLLAALGLMAIALGGLAIQSPDRYLFRVNLQSQLLAFAGYAYLAYGVLYRGWGRNRGEAVLMILAALSLRLALSCIDPAETLGSRDPTRYLLEGHATLGGFSPYQHAPNSPTLRQLPYGRLVEGVQYASIPTPYPPGAQLYFAAAAWMGGASLWGLKLLYLISEMVLFFSLRALCRRLGLPVARTALVFLNPLVLREAYLYGHYDLIPISWVAASLALLLAGRRIAGGAVLGIAGTVKLFPVFIAPLLMRRLGVRGVAVSIVVATAICLPFWMGAGDTAGERTEHLLEGLTTFSLFMKSNTSPIFDGLHWISSHFVLTAHAPTRWTQRIATFLGLAIACGLAWRFRRDETGRQTVWGLGFCLAATLTLSPFANPWYFIWLAPFLAFAPSVGLISLMALSILFTFPRDSGAYEWLIALEWTPFLLLYGWESVRALKTGRWPADEGP